MEWSGSVRRDGDWDGMAKDDHRELGIEVKNPGDEVERLGERSRRVIALSSSHWFPFQKKKGSARRGRSIIAMQYNG